MGQVAIVSGAARNLGAVLALALAQAGFDVVVNTRQDIEGAREVAREAESYGVSALAVAADVSDAAAVERMMDEASRLGDVHVLVNNASLRSRSAFHDLTPAQWRSAMAVTLDGAFLCSQAALPLMVAGGGGRIVNILGANAMAGDPERVHVSAAKHGLFGLTLGLSRACAADGVTVNAVSPDVPGSTDVDLRRHQVADVVTYLASQAAAAVTGQVIRVGDAENAARPSGSS